MKGQNPAFLSDFRRKSEGEGERDSAGRGLFRGLKWASGFFFLLGLSAIICAGVIYADILALRANVQPETWTAYMEAEGPPQAAYVAFSALIGLSLAAFAGIVYLFAAVSEALVRR